MQRNLTHDYNTVLSKQALVKGFPRARYVILGGSHKTLGGITLQRICNNTVIFFLHLRHHVMVLNVETKGVSETYPGVCGFCLALLCFCLLFLNYSGTNCNSWISVMMSCLSHMNSVVKVFYLINKLAHK